MKQKAICVQLKKRLCELMPSKPSNTQLIRQEVFQAILLILCRLCNEKTESIALIVSACSILAKSQYRKYHGKIGTYVHWLLYKKYHLQ